MGWEVREAPLLGSQAGSPDDGDFAVSPLGNLSHHLVSIQIWILSNAEVMIEMFKVRRRARFALTLSIRLPALAVLGALSEIPSPSHSRPHSTSLPPTLTLLPFSNDLCQEALYR
jgi:hypothetical protein